MFEKLGEQDTLATETNYRCERIDRMYSNMKEDLIRHESLAFELATKFEAQHDLLLQFAEHIESLKSHALVTDLHFEAYLPLQTACLAYEVGKGLADKDKMDRYKRHFAQKVIKNLEKNCLKVVDQESGKASRFQKIDYKIPTEI
jgi:hypothetical protein